MKRLLIHHNYKKDSMSVKAKLMTLMAERGFVSVDEDPDVIVAIGGDGTMLSAVRDHRSKKVPFIGINTGSLGFLPNVRPDNMTGLLDALESQTFHLQGYPLLKVICKTVMGDQVESYAFNEILIKHLEPRLMEAKIYINGKAFNYFTGDGFIISTPLGATGYAIWAGGVATHSELPVYQLTPLNPNDNSINRPLKNSIVVPLETEIDFKIIKAGSREVIVACDGCKVSNDYISELHIRASKREVSFLRLEDYDYFEFYKSKIIDKNISRSVNDPE